VDVGTDSTEPVVYPDFAAMVGKAALEGRADRGMLIRGSGVGVAVAAHKLGGIRAGLCHDTGWAHPRGEHDDRNGPGARGHALAQETVSAYPGAKFSNQEWHVDRWNKATALETRFHERDQIGGAQ
jgi:ribose 5-phosphate isomerase B